MPRRRAAMLAVVATLATACATPTPQDALESAGGEPIRLPAELCRGYFILPVTFPDRTRGAVKGETVTLRFVYDTGAVGALVDRDAAMRVKPRAPFGITALQGGRSGDVELGVIRARAFDDDFFKSLSLSVGSEIDGLLGVGAIQADLITLDYPAGEMRIEAGALPEPDGARVFSSEGGKVPGLELRFGLRGVSAGRPTDPRHWMDVQLGPQTRRVLIDSGSNGGLVVDDLGGIPTVAPPQLLGLGGTLYGFREAVVARLAVDGYLGPHRLEKPVVGEGRWAASDVPSSDDEHVDEPPAWPEIMGAAVMRHFVWTFDERNDRLRIERGDDEAIQFDSARTTGVMLEPDVTAAGARVSDILPNSPAASADIVAGDLVTHINGVRFGEQGCEIGSENTSASFRYTRQRDGAVADVVVPLETIVE